MKADSGKCPFCGNIVKFTGYEAFSLVKCDNCSLELVVPLVFSEMGLIQHLDSGKLFDVYEGFDLRNDKEIRAFILKKELTDFKYWISQCKEEVKAVDLVKHPVINPVERSGMCNGTFFLLEPDMEGFEGTNYDPNKLGEFEVRSVVDFIKRLAVGLEVCHIKSLPHHDVSMRNIFVDNNGNIILRNFFKSRMRYAYFNKSDMIDLSNPNYISPEKAEKGSEDAKGDVFSLGVIFYFMLTGNFPFEGESNIEKVYSRVKRKKSGNSSYTKIEYKEPIPAHKYRKEDLHKEVSDLIDSMLKPYPVQRPSIAEFLTELKRIETNEDKKKISEVKKQIVDKADTAKIPSMKKLDEE